MAFTLDTLTLPVGLRWSDKYDWTPVSQETEVLLYGTFGVDEAAQLGGRPITIVGGHKLCRAKRSVIDQLYALMQTANVQMTLDLGVDGSHTVIWRRDIKPLITKPFLSYDESDPDDIFIIEQLAFFEV